MPANSYVRFPVAMKLLFIHPNMPGQYKHLCRAFAANPENTVVFVTKPKSLEIENVHKVEYKLRREPMPGTHRYLIGTERGILTGQEVWRVCKRLKDEEGFIPDIVCAHPGWGDAMFVKDIFPDTPLLSFFEFYYHSRGVDVNFDPESPAVMDDEARVRTKNIINLLSLEAADWGFSPTHWQHGLHPKVFHHKMSVLHDGIDCATCHPDPQANMMINSMPIKAGDEIVTYIARNFEPYRGFPTFMRAAEIIHRERPGCHILAIGADEVSYGRQLPKGETWRHKMLSEVKVDMNRLHFLGTVPYATLIRIFQITKAHIYLTYPFVLSWSTLEAMACGVALVSSRTPPVEEVITHGYNGLLADFFSPEEVAARVFEVLDHPDGMPEMRANARKTVLQRYDLKKMLPLHVRLVEEIAARQFPPPVQQDIDALYSL